MNKRTFYLNRAFLYLLAVAAVFVSRCTSDAQMEDRQDEIPLSGTITISGASALYPLTTLWAKEFERMYPDVKITITEAQPDDAVKAVQAGTVDLAMTNRSLTVSEKKSLDQEPVASDVLLPVINSSNPLITDIFKNGITLSELCDAWTSETEPAWKSLISSGTGYTVKRYITADPSGRQLLSEFLGAKSPVKGSQVAGDAEMFEVISQNPFALGYLSHAWLFDAASHRPENGLIPLPIDFNNNGKLDDQEKVLFRSDLLLSAVSQKQFPKALQRELYYVSLQRSHSPLVRAFLTWTSNGGQRLVAGAGYSSALQ